MQTVLKEYASLVVKFSESSLNYDDAKKVEFQSKIVENTKRWKQDNTFLEIIHEHNHNVWAYIENIILCPCLKEKPNPRCLRQKTLKTLMKGLIVTLKRLCVYFSAKGYNKDECSRHFNSILNSLTNMMNVIVSYRDNKNEDYIKSRNSYVSACSEFGKFIGDSIQLSKEEKPKRKYVRKQKKEEIP